MCRNLEERTILRTFGGGLRGLPPFSTCGSDTCVVGGSAEDLDGLVGPEGVTCLTGLRAMGSVVFLGRLAGFKLTLATWRTGQLGSGAVLTM